MRHDHEDLKWLVPSIFVVMMLGWQTTDPGRAALTQAINGLSLVLQEVETAALFVLANVHRIDVIPDLSTALARWLVPLLIGGMILVSTLNAVRHQALAKSDRQNNRHNTPMG